MITIFKLVDMVLVGIITLIGLFGMTVGFIALLLHATSPFR